MHAPPHAFPVPPQIYGAGVAWGIHWAVARLLLKGMSVSSVPWSELLAYTGYAFFPVCLAILAGSLLGARGGSRGGGGRGVLMQQGSGSAAQGRPPPPQPLPVCCGVSRPTGVRSLCVEVPEVPHGPRARAGRAGYYAVWAYGSVVVGVFMVKSFKRVVQQERHYGARSAAVAVDPFAPSPSS